MSEALWTKGAIETELRRLPELICQAEQMRLDIEGWQEMMNLLQNEAIEAGTFKKPNEPDMPRSSTTSDPTARLAMRLPDAVELQRARIELAKLERRIRRIEAWMRGLPNRQKVIVKKYYAEGMVWGEVINTYNAAPTDGIPREERTLRRWRDEGVIMIEKLANS